MMKFVFKKNTTRALLLLLCASMILVAFPMASVSVSASEAPAEEQSEYVEVLRVIDDIKYGAKFTSDKLETVRVRADAVPADAIKTVGELYNKYAASAILVGDFLTPAKLLDKKPVDATDEEEDEDETEKLDYKALGYVVITDYEKLESEAGYGALINRVIAENPGRTIYIPDGTYIIEEPIVIYADPEKSVSLRLGNQAVLKADPKWEDPHAAMIRVGVEEPTEKPLTMDEVDMMGYRSISIIGGCIFGSNLASGISVEGGKDTYIYNVSLKSVSRAIHILRGNNELGATWVNVDNVNVTGTDKDDSVGVLVEGTYNTFSNIMM